MRILVTGGGGYLGSALIRRLVRDGYHVAALDSSDFGNPHPLTPGWGYGALEYLGDVRNENRIKTIVEREQIDTVVHLAAILTVQACEDDKELAQSVHVDGTRNAFSVPGTRNIHISTGAVFGEGGVCEEEDPTEPHTWYAKTKAMAEEIALDRDAVVLRLNYLGGYAPGTRWVETVNFLARDTACKGAVEVWEPHITHPFTHVEDAVDAIRCAIDSDVKRDVFHVLSANLERACLGAFAANRDAEVTTRIKGHLTNDLILSPDKMERVFGWRPKRKIGDAFDDAWAHARGVLCEGA